MRCVRLSHSTRKTFMQWILTGLLGLLTSGCWVASVSSAVVTSGQPPVTGMQLPVIQLTYGGQRVQGIAGE